MPLVSICIPAYNHLAHLQDALNSVFMQTFRDYEIIITDDSNNNDIFDYIHQLSNRDCIKYFKNQPSLGAPANWNRGLSLATGKFIKILHHDDQFIDENSLGYFVQALESSPNKNIVFCALLNRDASTGSEKIHRPSAIDLKRLTEDPNILFCGNFIGPPSGILFRAPPKYLFNEKLKWLVDIDFYMSNWTGKEFLFVPKVLMKISSGDPDQVTRSCEFDMQINAFEYLTLFDRLQNSLTKNELRKYIRKLRRIFANLNVTNIEEIRRAGFGGDIPKSISQFLPIIRFNQTLAKCLARI